jgi:chemotaxis protein MotB
MHYIIAKKARFTHAFLLLLACLCGLASAGCSVSRPIYERVRHERNALRHEVDRARVAGARQATLLAILRSDLAELVAERDVLLSEMTTEQADLARRLDDLSALNAELSDRLRRAGQSIEQLAHERGSLSAALEEARIELDKLRRQQADAEARVATLRDLAARFQGMIEAGLAHVTTRNGRALLELPGDALFHADNATLTPAGRAAIIDAARALRAMPNQRFQVAAHTDNTKPKRARFESSWHLSAGRAAEVVKLLVEHGVPAHQLSAAGYGEFAPVAPNATSEGRARNRRLEITIVPSASLDAAEAEKAPAASAAAALAAAPWPG